MLGLHLVEYKRPWLFREDFVARHSASLTDQDLLRFNREVNRAGRVVVAPYTSDGARRDGLPAKVNLIATYGDSHTAGAEVDDRETWQFYLEKQLGYEVKNFGVGGYSTDQALLKFEKNVARGEISPIVILGVFGGEHQSDRQSIPFILSTHDSGGFWVQADFPDKTGAS